MNEFEIEILPSGFLRIRRGDASYNESVLSVMSDIYNNDPKVMKEVKDFIDGSEEIVLLKGKRIMCG